MDTQPITMTRQEARELYRNYKKHLHYQEPIDHEIMRTYQLIAQGRVIIRALESIRVAGLNAQGLPTLAIMRADQKACFCTVSHDGSVTMGKNDELWSSRGARSLTRFAWPARSFATGRNNWRAEAIAPIIPVHLRPQRGLQNYFILWEAEWTKIVPTDPVLLRRIGKADLWLVVAAWNLTEVERAALATRISA